MKKLISCVSAVSALMIACAVGASADGAPVSADVNYKTNSIDVTYNSSLAYDSYITVYVAPSGAAEIFTDFENAVGIGSGVCEEGKETQISIKFDDTLDGSFDIFAVPSGVDSQSGYRKLSGIRILGKTSRDNILKDVNSASVGNIGSVIYENLREVLYIDEPSCPEWKSEYLYEMKNVDFGGSFSDFTQIDQSLKVAENIHFIRESDSIAMISEMLDTTPISGIDVKNKDYIDYKEKFVTLFDSRVDAEEVKTLTALTGIYDETAVIIAFNNRSISGAAAAISEYESILGISALKSKINTIGKEVIARQLENKDFSAVSEIKTAIENAVNSLYPKKPQSSGGGGGGGGGGGNSGSKAGTAVSFPVASGASAAEPKTEAVSDDKFTDIPEGHWAKAAVEALAEKSVINGYSDGSFRPTDSVKREEFVQMIVKAFGIEADGDASFEDIPGDHWAMPAVAAATSAGIVNGVSDRSFGLGTFVTRQDMAVIVLRTMNHKGFEISGAEEKVFTDAAEISDYAASAVATLTGSGIINGFDDGSFKPSQTLSRAEAAKVIYSLLNLKN